MHPLTLRFSNPDQEAVYLSTALARERIQGRTAIIVGVIVYLIYGLLDAHFVPENLRSTIWAIRLGALNVPLIVYLLSYTSVFGKYRHALLAGVGLAAGLGLIAMLAMLTEKSAANFYPGLVLATFYTYNFIGTRFIYALCVDLSLLITYNIIFGGLQHYPGWMLASHDFFIMSANLIGGIAGYLNEQQRRLLFLREHELDAERNLHLTRSLHDPLTGLPNRALLYDRLESAMAISQREGDSCCAMFIDLDGFKHMNDDFGHETGDRVLRAIALRLKDAMRDSDTVARLGGDEFCVITRGIKSAEDATALGDKLIRAVSEPILGVEGNLSASIGICIFPYPGMTTMDIIRRADHAMYRAKLNGKNNCFLASIEPEAFESARTSN